jgi:hypothetical protein
MAVERRSGYLIMTNCENSGSTRVIAPLISGETLSAFLGGKLRSASEYPPCDPNRQACSALTIPFA